MIKGLILAVLALASACVSPALAQTKAPMSGLVSMGTTAEVNGVPVNDLSPILGEPGVFQGVVVNIGWDAVEPSQGTFDTSTIDSALAAVSAYNAEYPSTPLQVRLNVEASLLAPLWAKALDGGSVVTSDTPNPGGPDTIFTIGRFWTADYQAAFTALQAYLAAKYDSNPLINEVTNTACSSETDEPFAMITTTLAITNMHAAGFTDAQYLACLQNSPADYAGWVETPLHWAFNPFLHTDSGVAVADEATTADIIATFRNDMGARAILANHDLQSGTLNGVSEAEYPNIALMYQQFKQLGGLINLQSNTAVQDWTDTISYGIASGATDIEFWPGTSAGYLQATESQSQLAVWSAELAANLQATLPVTTSGNVCGIPH